MAGLPIPIVTRTIYYQDLFLVREVKEETNLTLKDKLWLLDSYYYGDSLGLHFAVSATSQKVTCEPGVEHRWLSSLEEL